MFCYITDINVNVLTLWLLSTCHTVTSDIAPRINHNCIKTEVKRPRKFIYKAPFNNRATQSVRQKSLKRHDNM